jgi:hypothetical protein
VEVAGASFDKRFGYSRERAKLALGMRLILTCGHGAGPEEPKRACRRCTDNERFDENGVGNFARLRKLPSRAALE